MDFLRQSDGFPFLFFSTVFIYKSGFPNFGIFVNPGKVTRFGVTVGYLKNWIY